MILSDPYMKLGCSSSFWDATQISRLDNRTTDKTRCVALCRYCDDKTVPQSLNFSRNHAGKPQILWDEDAGEANVHGLQFNLSHTASLLGKDFSRCPLN